MIMSQLQSNNLQFLREKYIRELANTEKAESSTSKANKLADDLFALDLTVYSRAFSFKSAIYNAFATSVTDDKIALHPEQLRIITHIEKNDASIIRAC